MRWHTLLVTAAAVAPFAFAGDHVARDASAELHRPDGAPRSEAHGGCAILDAAEYDKFKVWMEGASGDLSYRVWLSNGGEAMSDLGAMDRSGNAWFFQRTTAEGGSLPFGVDTVRALMERRIEIRTTSNDLVLAGNVPVIHGDVPRDEPPPPDKPPHDRPEILSAKASFLRTDAAGDREMKGVVCVKRAGDDNAIRMEFARLDPETGYLIYMGAGDAMTLIDDVRANREGGAAFGREAGGEPGLPFGADDVSELAGMRVELRSLTGAALLYTEVPALETREDTEPVHEKDRHQDDETGADVKVVLDIRPTKGHEELRIVVRDIPRDRKDRGNRDAQKLDLRMDDGDGTLRTVDTVRIRGRSARVRYLTRRGDRLPFDAATLRRLSDRAFDLRRQDGRRVADGRVPRV